MVFIIDDDHAVRDSLGLLMETAGFAYRSFESAEHFLEAFYPATPRCLVLDVNMPGMNGLELQAELIRRNIKLPIIFISGKVQPSTKYQAIKAGAFDFLTKPVPIKLLIARIQTALENCI